VVRLAILNHERKNGIQLGTVGDECMECKIKHRGEEDYIPERLDYKPVYKFWVNNISHCFCIDCFKETLGDFVLLDPRDCEAAVEEKKPAKKSTAKKKEGEE
jgi:hypothetical protein